MVDFTESVQEIPKRTVIYLLESVQETDNANNAPASASF